VIAGEHEDVDMIEPRPAAPLPLRQPPDDVFQPPEAPGWLGELILTRERERSGAGISWRQVETGCPQIVERGKDPRADPFGAGARWARAHAAVSNGRHDVKGKRNSPRLQQHDPEKLQTLRIGSCERTKRRAKSRFQSEAISL
jgi:hypothetical protein